MVAAVDVAGGDPGPNHVVVGQRKVASVEGPAADARQRAGGGGIQFDQLPVGGRVARIGRHLAVHADVVGGQFDHAVGLAGHHEGVLGEADVQGLAAPPQRQVQPVRSLAERNSDGERTLEGLDRPAKRLIEGRPFVEAAGAEERHDLGIGRDGGRYIEALGGDQVGVVVDVAILDCRDEVRR